MATLRASLKPEKWTGDFLSDLTDELRALGNADLATSLDRCFRHSETATSPRAIRAAICLIAEAASHKGPRS